MKDIKVGTVIQNQEGHLFTVIGFELKWDVIRKVYKLQIKVINHSYGHCVAWVDAEDIASFLTADEPLLKVVYGERI